MMINIYDFICSNASFFHQLKFGKSGDIFIDYLCPIREEKTRAWCHKNCLMYVVQGRKGYSNVKDYYQSEKHQVLFIRKGGVILHQFKGPYRALIFMFEDNLIRDLLSEYPILLTAPIKDPDFNNKPTITPLSSNPFVKSIFISSLDYLKDPTDESAISLEIKFKELVINILRNNNENTFTSYLSWLCNSSDASFIKLIRENSSYNFTTKELARVACMSQSTFKREFARIFATSPGKWLREQRIIRAIALLRNTQKSISEIAFDLGYSDTAAFSKAVKMATHINPTDYREKSSNLA